MRKKKKKSDQAKQIGNTIREWLKRMREYDPVKLLREMKMVAESLGGLHLCWGDFNRDRSEWEQKKKEFIQKYQKATEKQNRASEELYRVVKERDEFGAAILKCGGSCTAVLHKSFPLAVDKTPYANGVEQNNERRD